MVKNTNVVIAAAGTGGHIRPGMAIADQLISYGCQVSWIGTANGMEKRLVANQYAFYSITSKPFRGKNLLKKIYAVLSLVQGVFSAWRLLFRIKPRVVLLMGGYISLPVGLASKLFGVSVVLHEQNSVPGMANRLMANFVQEIYTAYPNVFSQFKKTLLVGNPSLIKPIRRTQISNKVKNLLIIGGSLGAKSLNQCLIFALPFLSNYRIWHQLGSNYLSGKKFQETSHSNYSSLGFIDDMQSAYQWADIIVCRAGAMTVSEIKMVGKPALLIPYAYAVDDHQFHNALSLYSFHYVVLEEKALNPYRFVSCVNRLSKHVPVPIFKEEFTPQLKIVERMMNYIS